MIDLRADGFEYSEEEEQDDGAVDIENQYYNAKGASDFLRIWTMGREAHAHGSHACPRLFARARGGHALC